MPKPGSKVGRLADGRDVSALVLQQGPLRVEVWDYGATLRSLHFDGVEFLAGPRDLAGVEGGGGHFGRVVGRVAGRIAGARFELDGEEHGLDANAAPNTLHGGSRDWSHAVWRIEEAEADRCLLSHVSPDGDMGFPGEVRAQVGLALIDGALEIAWRAETDRATPVNMTHHPYFNLVGDSGAGLRDHRLTVAASAVLALGADLLPTGALLPVEGTPFDLRQGRALGEVLDGDHPQLAATGGLDACFALDAMSGGAPQLTLVCPASGLALEVETDQPGVQVFDAHTIRPPLTGAGIAIEPQGFPDAPNQPTFPSVTLRPGETYRRFARYRPLRL